MRQNKSILLVENDRVDAMMVKRALLELRVANRLDLAVNGEEALKFLRNPKNEKPCIILLDLNMPRMNGIEFLKIIKQDKIIKAVPVVVLTSSKEEQDKIDSFNLGVAGYMIKPIDYHQFVEIIQTIDLYWTVSEMPGDI